MVVSVVAGCGESADDGKIKLSLVAYSTPQAAYEQIIEAYQKTEQGKNVAFAKSFGASGDQSRAVESGLQADIVSFSLEQDMTRLVKPGLVAQDWNAGQYQGMITNSVVVIATRKGNPKNLRTWDDLIKPDIEVITPNPFTSGGARWNVLAGYGAKSAKGTDRASGVAYLNALFKNVAVQDENARKSLQTFISGKGDAILAYENEAIFVQQHNRPMDYVVPDETILIENPVAVTTNSAHPAEAKAFLDYLYTPAAQKIFVDNGYRPVVRGVAANFPNPPGLFTITDLGGWPKVNSEFFDPKNGIMADVERAIGVSVK
jgi:sulfate/thiosulfate-binding protein